MSKISRRHFLYGTVLAGAMPRGGFGSAPSLKALGLPVAQREAERRRRSAPAAAASRAISAVREPRTSWRLPTVDWARAAAELRALSEGGAGTRISARCSISDGKSIDAVLVATPDHTHAVAALAAHAARQGRLRREAAGADAVGGAPARRRRAEVQGRHADGQPGLLARGDARGERDHLVRRDRRGARKCTPGAAAPAGRRARRCRRFRPPSRCRHARLGCLARTGRHASVHERRARRTRAREYGFYLPFNWRGHTDFGTGGLIGDWGIHILGPANWALRLGRPDERRVREAGRYEPVRDSRPDAHPLGVPRARQHAAGHACNWYVDYNNAQGDAYTPPGMTVDQVRQIPGTGPTIAEPPGAACARGAGRGRAGQRRPVGGAEGRGGGSRRRARRGGRGTRRRESAAGQRLQPDLRRVSKGYLGTNGRGEGVGLIPGSRWAEFAAARPHAHALARPLSATGFAPARAASRRARTSASRGRTPSGSRSARSRCACRARLLWNGAKLEFTNSRGSQQVRQAVPAQGLGDEALGFLIPEPLQGA